MKNRNLKYKLRYIASVLIIFLAMGSCKRYLDQAPQANISDIDAFGNFTSFQGWVEEMYNCVQDINKTIAGNYYWNFNMADEVLSNAPIFLDDGNYWNTGGFLTTGTANTGLDPMTKRQWALSWYAIRKANIGLSKLNLLVGTDEEKNIIKGQCLFFRGWMHWQIATFWGGLPYIDTVLSSTATLTIPRLSFRATALKCAQDFAAAAALLPVRWDDTEVGKVTLGNNRERVSKMFALSFQAKALLWAASPMINEEETGSNTYDATLCKQAAAVFADVIQQCDATGAYKLQTWATRNDAFWVWSPSLILRSGGTEVIMNPTIYIPGYTRWCTCRTSSPVQFSAGNTRVEVPTANYIKNYAMANGLPITDPLSGYNPADPWTGREPRFYNDIVYDGVQMVTLASGGLDRFAQLYNGGRHKGGSTGSVTGLLYRKWTPLGCNPWDNKWGAISVTQPLMRLSDVYLLYSEAVLWGYGTPQSKVPGSYTAEEALNIIRVRGQIPPIDPKFTTSQTAFMNELIRERAVELAFEGLRFFDLKRWNINTQSKYLDKYAVDFDRGTDGKPINIQERLVLSRNVTKKHNWFPFIVSYTKLYKAFPQNPGW
jgi:starch-binding outer membrane protein, SusD/RagB family